ncbi:hypothetical protein LJB95_00450 [Paludibacteraceae bacterium OttesenSCG-928-F17]|nr:hypothetical protein [Paludibacteraceae bacterium OttesenSCG-928-F17]
MFNKNVLREDEFMTELEKVHKLSCRITEKLDNLLTDWELEEDDEELLQELHEQAETLQQDLYYSFNDDEEDED